MSTQAQFIKPMTNSEFSQLKDLYSRNGVRLRFGSCLALLILHTTRQFDIVKFLEEKFFVKTTLFIGIN